MVEYPELSPCEAPENCELPLPRFSSVVVVMVVMLVISASELWLAVALQAYRPFTLVAIVLVVDIVALLLVGCRDCGNGGGIL